MKKYVRTINNKIYDLSKYTDLKENEISYFIRNKEYKPNSKIISKAFKYKVYFCKKDIVDESDDIFDLIQSSDLIRITYDFTLTEVDSRTIEGIVNRTVPYGSILEIYTKQTLCGKSCYVLVWDKERGIIE